MKVSTLDLYDFIGVIVPGTVLLVGSSVLFDLDPIEPLLIPQDFGSLGAHLVLAYVAGQLVQALGNVIESIYWSLWKGMPTEWPVSNPDRNLFPSAVKMVSDLIGRGEPEGSYDDQRKQWKRMVSQARSRIYAEGLSSRLQVFNGIYGMFRGVLASVLMLASLGWKSTEVSSWALYALLLLIGLTSLYRMHRFAAHYASELFSNVASLARRQDSLSV